MSDFVAEFLAEEQEAFAGLEANDIPGLDPEPVFDNGPANDDERPAGMIGAGDSGVDLTALESGIGIAGGPQANRLSANPSPAPVGREGAPEPEKIRKWREEQKFILEKRDQAEEKKMQEMRDVAANELHEWYAQRANRLTKTKAANRKSEAEFIAERDSVKEGAEWERITKLCDINAKNTKSSSDLSRLKSLFIGLIERKQKLGVTEKVRQEADHV